MNPLVIAEIGINHDGSILRAQQMVQDAFEAGCKCVKFQCHVIDDEMIPNNVFPANANESIWDIMARCALTEEEDQYLKDYTEQRNMLYLSTPFSRAAADRLYRMGVQAFKIGSGECNNYPLVSHIASFGRPIILSTGMNDLESIAPAVNIIESSGIQYGLLQCTSMYPTPYDKVNLNAMLELKARFPKAHIGLSDHSIGNYASFAAVALGAEVIEKHFTHDKTWPGPDNSMSIEPAELADLIRGVNAISQAFGTGKRVLREEQPTIDFAYACVVAIEDIAEGDVFTRKNVWVKRPGTGEIQAAAFSSILGCHATTDIYADHQLKWSDVKCLC